MFQNGDDEKWDGTFKIDAFHRIRIPAVPGKGDEPFAKVFDVFRVNIFQDIDINEIPYKLYKEPVVIEDELETVVRGIVNGHKTSVYRYYCTEMQNAFRLEQKTCLAPFLCFENFP